MDTPIIIQHNSGSGNKAFFSGKLPTSMPKIIFYALIIIIVAEVFWGIWYVSRPIPGARNVVGNELTVASAPTAKLELTSSNSNVSVGQILNADINLDSGGRALDGVDLIIKYDPKYLKLEGNPTQAFTKGSAFPEYVSAKIDNTNGLFTVTGLVRNNEQASSQDGLFGTLVFKALAPGETQVSVVYQPSSTGDTNVIDSEDSRDILEKVGNLEVKIN